MLLVHFYLLIIHPFKYIHCIQERLKVIELSSKHKALIKILSAYKPQALSCKAFISRKINSNKDASRETSAERHPQRKKTFISQAFHHIYV